MGIKKGTKLTDMPKNHLLQIRVDAETVEKLNRLSQCKECSKSEIIRIGIDIQYHQISDYYKEG